MQDHSTVLYLIRVPTVGSRRIFRGATKSIDCRTVGLSLQQNGLRPSLAPFAWYVHGLVILRLLIGV